MTNGSKPVCYKCGGAGKFAAFSHIAGGACFACGGTGLAAGKAPKPAAPPTAADLAEWDAAYEAAWKTGTPCR
jgi:hypothetical protein